MDSSSDNVNLRELRSLLTNLHISGDYSDLKVICGENIHNVHKAIICPQSEFFSRACCDGRWKEGEAGRIVLHQGDADKACADAKLISWMIYYFYHFDYPEPPQPTSNPFRVAGFSENSRQEPQYHQISPYPEQQYGFGYIPLPSEPMTMRTNPVTHARMYAIADFYGASGLRKLVEKKFCEAANTYWNSDSFAEAIEIVYTTTVAENCRMRQVVKEVLTNHQELLDKPKIEACMREMPDIAFDTLKGVREALNANWHSRGGFGGQLGPPQGRRYDRY